MCSLLRLDRFSSVSPGKRKRDGEERLVKREERLVYRDWMHRYDAPLPEVAIVVNGNVHKIFFIWIPNVHEDLK